MILRMELDYSAMSHNPQHQLFEIHCVVEWLHMCYRLRAMFRMSPFGQGLSEKVRRLR